MSNYAATVIQLARLGDLAQTWPLIAALLRIHSKEKVALVVVSRLSSLAAMMVGASNVLSLDVDSLLSSSSNVGFSSWRKFGDLEAQLKAIRTETVINLNYHHVAAALAESIPAVHRLGSTLSDVLAERPSDSQTEELFRATVGQRRGVRHLSDIWGDYAGIDGVRSFEPLLVPEEFKLASLDVLKNSGLDQDSSPIALIPGSGLLARRWPLDKWVELAKGLSKLAPLLILGSAAEGETADEIIRQAGVTQGELTSLCGRTSLTELAGVLTNCRLVIGTDTGPLQLAGMIGRKCLGIYFGSMNYIETGPYGEGNIAITPNDPLYPCHEGEMESNPECFVNSIRQDFVTETATTWLNRSQLPVDPMHRVYRSELSQDGIVWSEVVSSGIDENLITDGFGNQLTIAG